VTDQERVARFVAAHDLGAPAAARALDLASEVGELAKEVNESTGYGDRPEDVAVDADEVGDALFALLALADEVGIDAESALEEAMAKYERRIDGTGDPGSGSGSGSGAGNGE
jgi:NTP pyrophosphatase (non-canonical NTP hydrolase)